MKTMRLATLKFFALVFLLLGLAGLIVSATISTHYLDMMPSGPVPGESHCSAQHSWRARCIKP